MNVECGCGNEDLENFVLHCPQYQDMGNSNRLFDLSYSENCVGLLLFENRKEKRGYKENYTLVWNKKNETVRKKV